MKISEAIRQLIEYQKEYGDIEMKSFDCLGEEMDTEFEYEKITNKLYTSEYC